MRTRIPTLYLFHSYFVNDQISWVLYGEDAREYAGSAVAGAGDVNGDGFDDLIIGAPRAKIAVDVLIGPEEITVTDYVSVGKAYIVYGSDQVTEGDRLQLRDLDGTNGFFFIGEQDLNQYIGYSVGYSVSGIGDLNSDGIDDVIVGERRANSSGQSYVIFGGETVGDSVILSPSMLNGTNGFIVDGVAFSELGFSVSELGDVNNDGQSDVLISASGNNSGYVLFGDPNIGASGSVNLAELDGSNGFAIYNANSVRIVDSAGDVNGDGINDILFSTNTNQSGVIFGKDNLGNSGNIDVATLDGTNGFIIQSDTAFKSVSSAGDVNGDGFDDLVLGSPSARIGGDRNIGKTYLIFGREDIIPNGVINTAELDGSNGFVLNGVSREDQSGHAVSGVGDINGDGFDDFAIGTVQGNENLCGEYGCYYSAGELYLILGDASAGNSGTINLENLNGKNGVRIQGLFGNDPVSAIDQAGDVNGDGFEDFIVGTEGDPGGLGQGFVVFGGPRSLNLNGWDGYSEEIFGIWGDDTLSGGDGNDRLIGHDGNDTLLGNEGNDILRGGTGKDHLEGGDGNDRLIGADQRDRLLGQAGDDILKGGKGHDAVKGHEGKDKLFGQGGRDRLIGGEGRDRLNGGKGNDFLKGGRHNDVLIGGGGQDTFAIARQDGRDRIQDFNLGRDHIKLLGRFNTNDIKFRGRGDNTVILRNNNDPLAVLVNIDIAIVEANVDTIFIES